MKYVSRSRLTNGGYSRHFLVATDDPALETLHRATGLPHPAFAVLMGGALGYGEHDIAQFLQANFGGRPRGQELTQAMQQFLDRVSTVTVTGVIVSGCEEVPAACALWSRVKVDSSGFSYSLPIACSSSSRLPDVTVSQMIAGSISKYP